MSGQESFISPIESAPIVVLFGGSPIRRDQVINLVKEIGDITIYGTLSEEDGLGKLKELEKVDLVLIGGRYDENQRIRIRHFAESKFPKVFFTEPGWEYIYDDELIKKDFAEKLKLFQV